MTPVCSHWLNLGHSGAHRGILPLSVPLEKDIRPVSSYVASISFSVFSFPLVAALCTLPYMVYQYRRYGRVPVWKSFVVFLFIFYITTAYYLVIMPLPESRDAVVAGARIPNLELFRFVRRIAAQIGFSMTDPSSWVATLMIPDVYEALFNVFLTVPFGIFMKYFFGCRWWQALVSGLALSLFFETSQLTGLWGWYAHPYRLFDVDDLLINTTGAMLGFWLAFPLTWHLPDIDDMNEESLRQSASFTTFTRRLWAFAIDVALCSGAFAVWTVAKPTMPNPEAGDLAALLVITGIVFVLAPALADNATFGQRLLELRIVGPDGGRTRWYRACGRYILLIWVFLMLPAWAFVLLPRTIEGVPVNSSLVASVLATVYGTWLLTVAVRAIRSARRHPFVMLNGILTDTRIMSLEQISALRGADAAGYFVSNDASTSETSANETADSE